MNLVSRKSTALGVMTFAAFLASGTVASAQGPNKCLAAKNKCASKKMQGLLKCHSTAEKRGAAVDTACLDKARDKFDGGTDPSKGCFVKAEVKNAGPCLTFGDTSPIENKVEAFVLDVVQELDPGYPTVALNACSAGKKKCVLKKAASILKCHEKAVKAGVPVDPACIQKAHDKFDGGTNPSKGCFVKLEAKPPCLTSGDTVALENKVDAFIQDVLCELGYQTLACTPPTPTPTLSPTPTPTTTSSPTAPPDCTSAGIAVPTQLPNQLTCTAPGRPNCNTNTTDCGNGWKTVGCLYRGPNEIADETTRGTGKCLVGTNAGASCTVASECPGGTCDAWTMQLYQWNFGTKCEGGPNDGASCTVASECPSGTCTNPTTTCLYLYRANPQGQGTRSLNGVHCYNTASCNICAFDYDGSAAPPITWATLEPVSVGTTANCSGCHTPGPIVPLYAFWSGVWDVTQPLNKKCAQKGGPIWIAPPTNKICFGGTNKNAVCTVASECPGGNCDDNIWAQRGNPLVKVGAPNTCSGGSCHSGGFVKGASFCSVAAKPAFLPSIGAMTGSGPNYTFTKRCLGGTNPNALCTVASECPGGSCVVPQTCVGGTNDGSTCTVASECPSGTCVGVCNTFTTTMGCAGDPFACP